MTVFARPEEDDLVNATSRAIKEIRMGRVRTDKFHEQVKSMYSWTDVAERTERVYEGICRGERVGLMERLKRYYGCGVWAGKLFVLCVVVDYLIWVVRRLSSQFPPRVLRLLMVRNSYWSSCFLKAALTLRGAGRERHREWLMQV
jgi:hypothetical protein